MKRLTAIFAALLWVGSAQAAPINGSFETGNLFGWINNDTTVVTGIGGQTPTDGNYMAYMVPDGPSNEAFCSQLGAGYTNCAYILQFTLLPYETLNFDWNFLDNDCCGFEDAAFFFNAGSGFEILAFAQSGIGGWQGWQTTSYNNPTGMLAPIVFAIANDGDTIANSALLIDNVRVPEPGSLALLGMGLLGFGFSRKRAA